MTSEDIKHQLIIIIKKTKTKQNVDTLLCTPLQYTVTAKT